MTMMTTTRPAEREIETIPLSDTSWRVCDAALPDDDATRLVAYVEQTIVGVEVLWMWPVPGACDTFSDIDDAFDAVTVRLRERRILRATS